VPPPRARESSAVRHIAGPCARHAACPDLLWRKIGHTAREVAMRPRAMTAVVWLGVSAFEVGASTGTHSRSA
jgi:hypothetical protein